MIAISTLSWFFSLVKLVSSRLLPALLSRRTPDQERGQQREQQGRPKPFRDEGEGVSEKGVAADERGGGGVIGVGSQRHTTLGKFMGDGDPANRSFPTEGATANCHQTRDHSAHDPDADREAGIAQDSR